MYISEENKMQGRLITYFEVNANEVYLRILRSTSGKSSKLEVSSMDRTWTGIAAGRSLKIIHNK